MIVLQGAKLQYGHVPVGSHGDDEGGRQFGSLHAVQRHMVDTNQCKLAWEDNEQEYEDFYDWGDDDDADSSPAGTRPAFALLGLQILQSPKLAKPCCHLLCPPLSLDLPLITVVSRSSKIMLLET